MYKYNYGFEYNSEHGIWEFNMPKALKDVHAQAGLKIVIDPGYPTGETGPIYDSKYRPGLVGPNITIKGYDNISGWVSQARFKLPELLEALVKIVPKDSVELKTFILALNDLKLKEEEDEK